MPSQNPYAGMRFIPASHVGQYQTMGGGQGGGLGTSWGGGMGLGGGGGMGLGGGGIGGTGPGLGQPNRQFAGLGPGFDQSTGQPWGNIQSLGLMNTIWPGGMPGQGGGGMNPMKTGPNYDPSTGQAWGTHQNLGLNLGLPGQGGGMNPAKPASWQDQQAALFANPMWGPLAQGVQSGAMDPGAALKQAQAYGAKPYETNYWAQLLGYNGGEAGFMGQGGGGGMGMPNYNPPPGYFNPSQTALQQGNYTQPNFTLAGQGGGTQQQGIYPPPIPGLTDQPGAWSEGGSFFNPPGMAPLNQPKSYQQQAAPNPPMAYGGMNPSLASLLGNPTFGPLAQQVLGGGLQPQAAVKQAQGLGAGNQQIADWAKLLGY